MPKMKSHKGIKKRFSLTGTGKLKRRQANLGHLMDTKNQSRVRRLKGKVDVSKGDQKNIRKLLDA